VEDLIGWLRVQLDDDERVARDAVGDNISPGEEWHHSDRPSSVITGLGDSVVDDSDAHQCEHIARWDPACVLAEVEAKRRILDLHTGTHACPEMRIGTYPADWPTAAPYGKAGESWEHAAGGHFDKGEPCPTVRLVALPFADRSGYRPEWAPA
jgi:hypothetical protein